MTIIIIIIIIIIIMEILDTIPFNGSLF